MATTKNERAKITPKGRAHILKRALAYPYVPRTKLAQQIQVELEEMKEDVPQIEVLERKISKFRNHSNSKDPKDEPWDIGKLDDYPVPAEALPVLVKVWYLSEECEPYWTLSIRQAIWVSRLYPFYANPEDLHQAARNLADEEIVGALLETEDGMRSGDFISNMRLATADLYEKASGERLTAQIRDKIAKHKPVTAWGLQETKRFLTGPVELVQNGESLL